MQKHGFLDSPVFSHAANDASVNVQLKSIAKQFNGVCRDPRGRAGGRQGEAGRWGQYARWCWRVCPLYTSGLADRDLVVFYVRINSVLQFSPTEAEQRVQWAKDMRRALSPPDMLHEDGSVKQEFFKPKKVHAAHSPSSAHNCDRWASARPLSPGMLCHRLC